MKQVLFTLSVILSTTFIHAQVTVMEGSKSMVEGTYNAYSLVLEDVESNLAEKIWEDFMREYKAKVKKDKKAKILFADNVQIPSISANPVDVYTNISGDKGQPTEINVWFDTGSGYVNSIDMEVQSEKATQLIEEYGSKVMRKHCEEMQAHEEKLLKDYNSDIKKLESKNSSLVDDIAKAKDKILKWEKELEQNEDDIKKKKKEIEIQKEKVADAKEATRKY